MKLLPIAFTIFFCFLIGDALLQNSLFAPSAFLIVFLITGVLAFAFLCIQKSSDLSFHFLGNDKFKGKFYNYLYLLIIILLTIIITSYRYLQFPNAYGPDVPDYLLYTSSWMHGNFFADSFVAEHGVVVISLLIVRTVIENFFHLQFDYSLMVYIPLIIGLYSISVYNFVKVGTNLKFVAFLSTVFTLLSVFTVRLSYDLFGQLIGIAFSLLFMSFYMQLLNKPSNKKLVSFSVISLLLVFLSHFMTFFILATVVCLFTLSKAVEKKLRSSLMVAVKVFVPTLITLIAFVIMFTVARPNYTTQLLPTVIGTITQFKILVIPNNWVSFSPLSLDSRLFWVITIIGVLGLLKLRDNFSKLLLAWPITVCIGLFVLGFQPAYRLLMYLPIGIFGGYGLGLLISAIYRFFESNFKNCDLPSLPIKHFVQRLLNLISPLFIIIIICALFISLFPQLAVPAWGLARPTNEAEEQLSWVAENYGYLSGNVLLLTTHSEQNQPNLRRWQRALSGADIFGGDLIMVLNNQSDWFVSGTQYAWMKQPMVPYYWNNLSKYSVIVMPGAYYPVGPFERAISQKVPGQDIYIYNTSLPKSNISTYVKEHSVWSDNMSGWVKLYPELMIENSLLTSNLTLTMNINNSAGGLAVWEKPIPCVQGRELFMHIKGNLTTQIKGSIEIYYQNSTVTGFAFPDQFNSVNLTENYSWMYCELISQPIDRLRLVVESSSSTPGTYYLQIDALSIIS